MYAPFRAAVGAGTPIIVGGRAVDDRDRVQRREVAAPVGDEAVRADQEQAEDVLEVAPRLDPAKVPTRPAFAPSLVERRSCGDSYRWMLR